MARPWLTGRTSAAALVRKVDVDTPTLLLDESDAAFAGEKSHGGPAEHLNTEYKRSGKCSLCVGKGADLSVGTSRRSARKPWPASGAYQIPSWIVPSPSLCATRHPEPVERWRGS